MTEVFKGGLDRINTSVFTLRILKNKTSHWNMLILYTKNKCAIRYGEKSDRTHFWDILK